MGSNPPDPEEGEKKHKTAAAHTMIVSGSVARDSKVDRIERRMAGVMGNLTRLGCDVCSR